MADTRSQDFRVVFSNIFSVTFTGTEMSVTYGVLTAPGTGTNDAEHQVAVFSTPTGAKMLATTILTILTDFEETTGQTIPLDQAKMEDLANAIKASKRTS